MDELRRGLWPASATTHRLSSVQMAPVLALSRPQKLVKERSSVHESVLALPAVVEVDEFSFWYGRKQALFDIEMNFPRGKLTALVGPSGCGKSTLLRSLNRLNDLVEGVRVAGDLRLDGHSIYGRGVDVIDLRKRVGMVFQKPNPFPMSIFENVVYSLRIDGQRDPRRLEEVCETKPAQRRALERGQGPLARERPAALRRPAAAPVHRARDCGRAGAPAAGRTLLGARPDRHRPDRGPARGAQGRVLDR